MFKWFSVPRAKAHCDIPCGIYDPLVAKIAAQTVQKMVLRMQNLEHPAPGSDMSCTSSFCQHLQPLRHGERGTRGKVQRRAADPLG